MRVDQPCAALAQQPADDQKAPQVSSRPDWAHQRDVPHRDIWVGELSFSLCGTASGEDGGELGREALREQDRLSSGTADVHACDETQDRRTRSRGGVGLNAWHLSCPELPPSLDRLPARLLGTGSRQCSNLP